MLDKQYFLRWVGLLAEWNQFNLTASAASMYMGGVSVVARSGGTLRETIGPGANLACYYATKYDTVFKMFAALLSVQHPAFPRCLAKMVESAAVFYSDPNTDKVRLSISAVKRSIGSTTGCTITEKAPTRAFSWLLKAPTSAFTFKTLLRHYAKRALTQQ